MKKIQFFSLVFIYVLPFILLADTTKITSFENLMDTLNQGKEVRVIIHYGACKLISDNEEKSYSPNAIGGMSIDVYEYFPAGIFGNKHAYVVFSKNKLIENPIGKGYVYNYVKIKISDDNSIRIIARYLDSINFKEIMDESFYTDINNKDTKGGFYLYSD